MVERMNASLRHSEPMRFQGWVLLRFSLLIFALSCSDDGPKRLPTKADSGFELEKHAFKFENFAFGYDASVMTPELAARMFGEKNVCQEGMDGCVPTPDALAWIDTVNRAMEAGRCEGFAVLSQLFFLDRLDPSDFGAETASELDLEENYALQRELAYWFATQLVPEAVENKALMPREAVHFMAKFMKPGSKEFYRIGMVQQTTAGFGDAHSLTPLGFAQGESANIYYVRVYDNNYPDVERQIRLDVDANTWEYKGVTSEGEVVFKGGEDLGNPLYFAPTAARDGELPCPFCTDTGTRTITVHGAQPLVTTGDGNQVGIKDGKVVEGGGSKVSPGFGICAGANATIQLTAKATSDMPLEIAVNKGEGARQSVSVQGGALGTVNVSGELSTGSKSGQIQVSPDSVSVQPAGGSSKVSFSVGKTIVELDVSGDAGNVTVTRDPNTGELTVKSDKADGARITVTVTDNSSPYSDKKPTTSFSIDGSDKSSELSIALPKGGYSGGVIEASVTVDGKTEPVAGAHCNTGQKDKDETDVDCGGATCGACRRGKACLEKRDCAVGTCASENTAKPNTCVAFCEDGRKDDSETDFDCGGSCALEHRGSRCAIGKVCTENNDCTMGVYQETWYWSVGKAGYEADEPAHCFKDVCTLTPRIQGSVSPQYVSGLQLKLSSDGVDQILTVDGQLSQFYFPDAHVVGDYTVSIAAQPPGAICQISQGASGTLGSATWVDNIRVACVLGKDTCANGKKDIDETDVDCGGNQCRPWGKYCGFDKSCVSDADCGNPSYSRICLNNTCKRAYGFSGGASATVPVTVELSPGGDYSGPSNAPQQRVVPYGQTKLEFAQTRVTDAYSLSVVPQNGVTCTFRNLPASPLTVQSDWIRGWELRCTSCANGAKEAYETDVDCGGSDCRKEGKKCGADQGCLSSDDCTSNICTNRKCGLPPCNNGIKDTGETDVDCGGGCVSLGNKCNLTKGCSAATDCTSGICDTTANKCVSCSDGIKNGTETGTDCGGTTCVAAGKTCAVDASCNVHADCSAGSCDSTLKVCVSCSDGVKNGSETATDCGGGCVSQGKTCALNAACAVDADCGTGICDGTSNKCVSCTDGTKNGSETDVDCGGSDCRAQFPCAANKGCSVSADCDQGTNCSSNMCVAAKTWSQVTASAFSATKVEDAAAVASDDIWVSGGDYLAHYTGTWSEQRPLGAGTPITGMFALNDGMGTTNVWVLADDNVISEWNGVDWFAKVINFVGSSLPFPKLNDIHGTSEWMLVVGSEGQIAERDGLTGEFSSLFGGGGPTQMPPTFEDLHAVYVLDNNHAYAVGAKGTIVTFDTGLWKTPTSPTNTALRDVWAIASDDVWAVGDGGVLIHYDGQSWSLVDTGVTRNLASVWAADATHVFAVGAGGTVLFTDGQNLSVESAGTSADLGVVFGFDTTRWAMGTNSVLIQEN